MQRYCTELTERLLKSLDKEYNVVEMGAVTDVIAALEKTTITKEVLEVTRLGKYINELRRKTNNDALAKRAKDLVRRWRDMVLPSSNSTSQPTQADTAPQTLNGTKPQSPALRGLKPNSPAAIRALKPHSPALKGSLMPQSPLLRDSTPLKVLSPALSLNSDRSRSPNPALTKLQLQQQQYHHHYQQQQQQQQQQGSLSQTVPTTTTTSTTNHRLNTDVSPKLGLISTHNHTFDAVPRTHSSNKRLRKDDSSGTSSPITPPIMTGSVTSATLINRSQLGASTNDNQISRFEPMTKRPRLNGETSLYTNFPNTTDTSNNNVVSSRVTTINSSVNVASTISQKVPSPREMEKTNDRLSDVASCNVDNSRDTIITDVTTITTTSLITTPPSVPTTTAITTPPVPTGPKKRGRKKGSKSVKNQALPEDRVKEKLASISRNPKLKTTQELLADLQARGSTTSTNFATGQTTTAIGTTTTTTTTTTTGITSRNTEAPSNEEILRNAANDDRPLSSRFLRAKREKTSQIGKEAKRKTRDSKSTVTKRWDNTKKKNDDDEVVDDDDEDDDDSERDEISVDVDRTRELTVEEILAKLPPIDRDAISWSDSDDFNDDTRNAREGVNDEDVDENDDAETMKMKSEIFDKNVERLHGECVEGLNGNYQTKIDDTIKNDTTIIARDESEIIDEMKSKCVYRRLGGNEKDREFREWHEMLARPSYEGQTLHILPYVIID